MNGYDPKKYWEHRLRSRFSITGVGNIVFDDSYNEYLYKMQLRVLKKALKKYDISLPGKNILDVGCGTGFFSEFYLMNSAQITGIDITTTSIESLKRSMPGGNFITMDISAEPTADGRIFERQFDIVNMLNVIFHIVDDVKFEKALDNLTLYLKEGGYLFISDYYSDADFSPAQHVKFRSLEKYKILKQKGVQIIDIIPIYHLLNRRINILSLRVNNLISPLLFIFDVMLNKLQWRIGNNIKLLIGRK